MAANNRLRLRGKKQPREHSVPAASCEWGASVLYDTLPWVALTSVWAYILMILREFADWKALVRRCVDAHPSTDGAVIIRRINSLMPLFEKSESRSRSFSFIGLRVLMGSTMRRGVPSEWQECIRGTSFAWPARLQKPRIKSYCRHRPA